MIVLIKNYLSIVFTVRTPSLFFLEKTLLKVCTFTIKPQSCIKLNKQTNLCMFRLATPASFQFSSHQYSRRSHLATGNLATKPQATQPPATQPQKNFLKFYFIRGLRVLAGHQPTKVFLKTWGQGFVFPLFWRTSKINPLSLSP